MRTLVFHHEKNLNRNNFRSYLHFDFAFLNERISIFRQRFGIWKKKRQFQFQFLLKIDQKLRFYLLQSAVENSCRHCFSVAELVCYLIIQKLKMFKKFRENYRTCQFHEFCCRFHHIVDRNNGPKKQKNISSKLELKKSNLTDFSIFSDRSERQNLGIHQSLIR